MRLSLSRRSSKPAGLRQSVKIAHTEMKMANLDLIKKNPVIRNSMNVQSGLYNISQALETIEENSNLGVLAATEAFQELQKASEDANEELRHNPEPELSQVEFKAHPKAIVKALNPQKETVVPVTMSDILYFETSTIDGLWVYENELSPDVVQKGLQDFLTESQTFAGRFDPKRKGIRTSNLGVPFTVQYASGSYKSVERDPSPRQKWLNSPAIQDIVSGKAPLMTVVLTQLQGGGSVLGVFVSHGTAGGLGWFGTCMPRFAYFCQRAAGVAADQLSKNDLGFVVPVESREAMPKSQRSKKEMAEYVKTMQYRPLNFNDPVVGPLKRNMFYGTLRTAADRPRVLVNFCKEELDNMKSEAMKTAKDVKFLSTAEVCGAHCMRVMSTLCPSRASTPSHIGTILDHTAKLGDVLPTGVVANTFYLYSAVLEVPPHEMELGEVAQLIHKRVHGIFSNKQNLIDQMQLQEDLLKHNYQPNSELKLALPYVFNNQSKFKPLIQLDFGSGKPHMYSPHNQGDSILLVPATNGGIDAWLSTVNALVGDPLKLQEEDLQNQLHAFM